VKRIVLLAALLITGFCVTSCGVAKGLAQSAGRLVQSAGRTVGL
jgi:hypothetical protein